MNDETMIADEERLMRAFYEATTATIVRERVMADLPAAVAGISRQLRELSEDIRALTEAVRANGK